ncbi:MAG: hypothetical protein PHT95_00360 [Candidatus Omnitrophica bacterium]|nr:hypothetical protein [Candidatus Omnitrophota bacterium]MDD4012975.1 hypothetical protein [Candidatus Omnitrophota bacterium]
MNTDITGDARFMTKVIEGLPMAILIVDDDVKILGLNAAAKKLVPGDEVSVMKKGGEFLHCVNETDKGCGKGRFCKGCVIRGSVEQALKDMVPVLMKRAHMKLDIQGKTVLANLLITAAPIENDGVRFVALVIQDVNELINLSRLLPICSNCKKIRDENGSWETMEEYFEDRVNVDFSHGMCPDCMKRLYGMQLEEGS